MAKPIESIFEECIQRIQLGESIESCLQRYPDMAPELQTMLRTFVNVNWRASLVQPEPNFKARARMQLQREMYTLQQEHLVKQVRKPTSFNLQRAWIPAAICICVLLFGSVGTAAASTDAMPDQPLYPVKLATEQVQLALSFSDNDKAMTNMHIAESRSKEIAVMAAAGKTDQVIATTSRLVNNLNKADTAMQKVAETNKIILQSFPQTTIKPVSPSTAQLPPKTTQNTTRTQLTDAEKIKIAEIERLKNSVENSMKKNISVLESVLEKAPETSKSALQNAITTSRNKQEVFQQTLPATTIKLPEINKPELPKPNNTIIPFKPPLDPSKTTVNPIVPSTSTTIDGKPAPVNPVVPSTSTTIDSKPAPVNPIIIDPNKSTTNKTTDYIK
jgi:hypothetical protein